MNIEGSVGHDESPKRVQSIEELAFSLFLPLSPILLVNLSSPRAPSTFTLWALLAAYLLVPL